MMMLSGDPPRSRVLSLLLIVIVASLALLVVSIAAAARIGATIYSRAIVRTGRKLTVREALRST